MLAKKPLNLHEIFPTRSNPYCFANFSKLFLQTARRQLAMEKQKKLADDTLKKLIGVTSTELTRERMTSYNVNTLQVSLCLNSNLIITALLSKVILNDIRDKIEYHNAELVTLLMEKDELENEQDSMLMDMEDIPHSALI